MLTDSSILIEFVTNRDDSVTNITYFSILNFKPLSLWNRTSSKWPFTVCTLIFWNAYPSEPKVRTHVIFEHIKSIFHLLDNCAHNRLMLCFIEYSNITSRSQILHQSNRVMILDRHLYQGSISCNKLISQQKSILGHTSQCRSVNSM